MKIRKRLLDKLFGLLKSTSKPNFFDKFNVFSQFDEIWIVSKSLDFFVTSDVIIFQQISKNFNSSFFSSKNVKSWLTKNFRYR